MPTTRDVKNLIEGVVSGDWQRVVSASNTIAKKLSKQGHKEDAEWIKNYVAKRDMPEYLQNANNNNWFHITHPDTSIDELIVPARIKEQIYRVVKEYDNRLLLRNHGLSNTNKILLVGKPGTGKSMTASILANLLKLPLNTIRQENVVESLMGKTAHNLSAIMPTYSGFDTFPAVFFFDEFDTFASKRINATRANDREYNQITNVLLKEMDHINNDCFFVAATNLDDNFDPAGFRRFDMVIKFPDTTTDVAKALIINNLEDIAPKYVPSVSISQNLLKFPPSVIKGIALEAKKQNLLDSVPISDSLLLKISEERLTSKESNDYGKLY